MSPIAAAEVVPAPRAAPPAQGLLVAADVVDHDAGDERWVNGLSFSPENCSTGEAWAATCGQVGNAKGTGHNHPAARTFEPFAVIARDTCGTFGWQAAEYEARARRTLARVEAWRIENEFWTGTLIPTNYRLAAPASAIAGQGLGRGLALAALEQSIADGAVGLGMIHARVGLVSLWWGDGLLRYDGNRIRTALGTLIVAGQGYAGTGPAGQVPANATEWAYATGPLIVHRGPVVISPDAADETERLAQASDKVNNIVEFRAERFAGVAWAGCLAAAVEVAVTVP